MNGTTQVNGHHHPDDEPNGGSPPRTGIPPGDGPAGVNGNGVDGTNGVNGDLGAGDSSSSDEDLVNGAAGPIQPGGSDQAPRAPAHDGHANGNTNGGYVNGVSAPGLLPALPAVPSEPPSTPPGQGRSPSQQSQSSLDDLLRGRTGVAGVAAPPPSPAGEEVAAESESPTSSAPSPGQSSAPSQPGQAAQAAPRTFPPGIVSVAAALPEGGVGVLAQVAGGPPSTPTSTRLTGRDIEAFVGGRRRPESQPGARRNGNGARETRGEPAERLNRFERTAPNRSRELGNGNLDRPETNGRLPNGGTQGASPEEDSDSSNP
ncbi:hypothetical protein QBC47DRAFT_428547 [Echria macrotheca]|uniref:Uncharacterized protein n=1 Tax=Echria macrotheca TaxID=438768 RepID=A0AAJ0BN44_9PEZI|nr:hypothetical protein QBC47DRAFT_428547 [Echria macrotheca]